RVLFRSLGPGSAVGGTVDRTVEAVVGGHGEVEGLADDLAGLAQAEARAGVQGVERLVAVLGGEAKRDPFGLGVSAVGKPGAGARAAYQAVDVALGFAVADEDEFGGDHADPRGQGRGDQL